VAIFSVNGFDAATVNVSTVRFGATGTEAVPINVALRDLDGDGDLDMVLRFQIPDTGIKCGDTSAILTGQISNGPSIIGSSPIKTVQCPQAEWAAQLSEAARLELFERIEPLGQFFVTTSPAVT
jgi:hypothetical protein